MTELLVKRLRNNEYYGLQPTFDKLFHQSQQGKNFNKLYELIAADENILLAFRNMKGNTGSKTKGANGHTVQHLSQMEKHQLLKVVKKRLKDYQPDEVRRIFIPKKNGELRPLGIPTIEDRLIQQAMLQVLEPICEGKFHNSSFGFRPARSTHHAIARCQHLINHSHNHIAIDIDIKGFFDNVNHEKLLKQLWTIGIRDKKVLSIISKMLKAPIDKEGIPGKGTPQGGILSPLLANVVLNELDWWISNQWETKPTRHAYSKRQGKIDAMKRNTSLKPCFIVRYADDFKIFTNNLENGVKLFNATQQWLKERLDLEISEDKSKIVNLRTHGSDFLGYRFKAVQKGTAKNSYVCRTKLDPRTKEKIIQTYIYKLNKLRKSPTQEKVFDLNHFTLGIHNYYKKLTDVRSEFNDIRHLIHGKMKTLIKRNIISFRGERNEVYKKFYPDYSGKTMSSCGITLYPIEHAVKDNARQKKPEVTIYTEEGRLVLHKNLETVTPKELEQLRKGILKSRTVLYADNRISRYVGQQGRCHITGVRLIPDEVVCHHKLPLKNGGTDEYENLVIIHKMYHSLIHSKDVKKVKSEAIHLTPQGMKKLNELRGLAGYSKV